MLCNILFLKVEIGKHLALFCFRRNTPLQDVLPLIVQVNCEEELKNRISEFSPSNWELLFQLKLKLEEGYCLHCSKKFISSNHSCKNKTSWTILASLLVQETNIEFALALLSKYSCSIPAGSFDLNFYQSCLLATIAETQSVGLKLTLLQAVTNYKTMPAISPEVSCFKLFFYLILFFNKSHLYSVSTFCSWQVSWDIIVATVNTTGVSSYILQRPPAYAVCSLLPLP